MSKKSKEYIALKNLMHNEFKISQQELRELFLKVAEDEMKSFIQRHLDKDKDFLLKTVEEKACQSVNNLITGTSYNSKRTELFNNIGALIVEKLDVKLK